MSVPPWIAPLLIWIWRGGGCFVVRRVPHNELDDDEYVADEGHGIYVLPGECYLVCGEESIIYGNRTTSIL